MKKDNSDFGQIAIGDTVEMLVPAGRTMYGHQDYATRRGRVVMRGNYGWVLNLGGRHGTPGVCDPVNFVRIVRRNGKAQLRGFL